jgi:hypothetical protein
MLTCEGLAATMLTRLGRHNADFKRSSQRARSEERWEEGLKREWWDKRDKRWEMGNKREQRESKGQNMGDGTQKGMKGHERESRTQKEMKRIKGAQARNGTGRARALKPL